MFNNNHIGILTTVLLIIGIVISSENGVVAGKRALALEHSGENSPFGIQDLSRYDSHMADLGVVWARISGATGLVWDADEPEPGKYDFRRIDGVINSFSSKNIHLLATIICYNRWDQDALPEKSKPFKYGLPKNISSYTDYIKTAVKRYPQISYYQIENEPANVWSGPPEDFAKLIKITSLAIKEANPLAKIVLAGAASPESFFKFYVQMLRELKRLQDASDEQYIHIVDLHWSGQFEYQDKSQGNYRTETFPSAVYDLKTVLYNMRREFDAANFLNLPFWITEMSDYSGKPRAPNYLYQSEQEHATEVFKRHVYSMSIGVEKVFWVGIQELHNFGNLGANSYWENTGLINNPQNDGQVHKKISYYTYKKMVEILNHSDWEHIDIIQESGDIFICRFIKYNRPIYIAWNDSNELKAVNIFLGEGIRRVKITKAVPQYTSGKDIIDIKKIFETEIHRSNGGRINILLNQIPVIVEVK